MSILKKLLLVLSMVAMALSYPFFPPTCYSKALNMARDLTQMAADLRIGYETVSQLFRFYLCWIFDTQKPGFSFLYILNLMGEYFFSFPSGSLYGTYARSLSWYPCKYDFSKWLAHNVYSEFFGCCYISWCFDCKPQLL